MILREKWHHDDITYRSRLTAKDCDVITCASCGATSERQNCWIRQSHCFNSWAPNITGLCTPSYKHSSPPQCIRLQETKGLWEQQAASPDLTSPHRSWVCWGRQEAESRLQAWHEPEHRRGTSTPVDSIKLTLRWPLSLPRQPQYKDIIASCSPYKEAKPCKQTPRRILNKQSDAQLETFAEDYGFTINKDLTNEQRRDLLQLLYDYKGSFARILHQMYLKAVGHKGPWGNAIYPASILAHW